MRECSKMGGMARAGSVVEVIREVRLKWQDGGEHGKVGGYGKVGGEHGKVGGEHGKGKPCHYRDWTSLRSSWF